MKKLTSTSKSNPFPPHCSCEEFGVTSSPIYISSVAGRLRDPGFTVLPPSPLTLYWNRRAGSVPTEDVDWRCCCWEKPGRVFCFEMYHGLEGLVSTWWLWWYVSEVADRFFDFSAICRRRFDFSSAKYCSFFLHRSSSTFKLWWKKYIFNVSMTFKKYSLQSSPSSHEDLSLFGWRWYYLDLNLV